MEQELRDFGLSDNEIKVYLILLRQGSMGPSELSKRTGFARPYIYDLLQRLQEKGVASTLIQDQKRIFNALNPNHLVEISKQKLEALETITEKLEALRNIDKMRMDVQVHTGKFVFRALLNDILITLKKGDEALFMESTMIFL